MWVRSRSTVWFCKLFSFDHLSRSYDVVGSPLALGSSAKAKLLGLINEAQSAKAKPLKRTSDASERGKDGGEAKKSRAKKEKKEKRSKEEKDAGQDGEPKPRRRKNSTT